MRSSPDNLASDADRTLLAGVRCAAFDFDGVFTDNMVIVSEDGKESVRCSRADGIGLSRLRASGVLAVVISTEKNPVVSARCRKLNLPCVQGSDDKVASLVDWLKPHGIELAEVSFLGNDVNDEPVLKAVGFPAVVADAHPDVIGLARYRTLTPGGHGAVREFCDLISSLRSLARGHE